MNSCFSRNLNLVTSAATNEAVFEQAFNRTHAVKRRWSGCDSRRRTGVAPVSRLKIFLTIGFSLSNSYAGTPKADKPKLETGATPVLLHGSGLTPMPFGNSTNSLSRKDD